MRKISFPDRRIVLENSEKNYTQLKIFFAFLFTCFSFSFEEAAVAGYPTTASFAPGLFAFFFSLLKTVVHNLSLHLLFLFHILSYLFYIIRLSLSLSHTLPPSSSQVYLLLRGPPVRGNQDEQQPSLPPPSTHPITPQLPG